MRPMDLSRRGFLGAMGVAAAGISLGAKGGSKGCAPTIGRPKPPAVVMGAFLYPPTASLREAGYYSWPGASFDAEGRQRQYLQALSSIETDLGMKVAMEESPLDTADQAAAFIKKVKDAKPDGLLLIPFKKGHWGHVTRIVEETKRPAVVMVPLGVLLVDHIKDFHRKPGVYLINSEEDFGVVAEGLKMIRTAQRMRESRLIDITNADLKMTSVPHLGTELRKVPLDRFYDEFARTEPTEEVKDLADSYLRKAKSVVEPTKTDILDAARTYFALKALLRAEEADALMMTCLPGLMKPHKHVPPCMGFMSLRDEGIPAGCQSDLNATLTLMLLQELFDKPGFQQNASMDTEKNHYFGAHCTSPSKMNGINGRREPYMLMSHAEAGWGCVPRVLFPKGQKVTIAQYLFGDKPQMYVYTGEVVGCPEVPRTGGCRTNVEIAIDDVEDACDVKGMHQAVFYGDHGKALRQFCQLFEIEALA